MRPPPSGTRVAVFRALREGLGKAVLDGPEFHRFWGRAAWRPREGSRDGCHGITRGG